MRIGIIGGGAAGMMAAATLLEKGIAGSDIFLFDKNARIGVKVALTGGGRCNVTTSITERKVLFSKYTRGADFLKPAFELFGPRKVFQWFESQGLPLYIQEDLRVFPRSDKGQDVVEVFEILCREGGLVLRLSESVLDIQYAPGSETRFTLITDKDTYGFDVLILTTGGNAYAHTGSSGDGYNLARNLGHDITPLGPSLNSFEVSETWCHDISGLALPNARLEVTLHDGTKKSVTGPMLFTHFGISGPATFALSSHMALEKISSSDTLTVGISLDATRDFQTWDTLIRTACEKESTKQVKTILGLFIPSRLVDVIMSELGIDREGTAAHFSKEERKKLIHLLSGQLKVTIINRRPGDEFVTAGGISLAEIDPKTMQSKIIPGMYFAGEILNVDGVTGGFNLQAAWAMGRVAGLGIS